MKVRITKCCVPDCICKWFQLGPIWLRFWPLRNCCWGWYWRDKKPKGSKVFFNPITDAMDFCDENGRPLQ